MKQNPHGIDFRPEKPILDPPPLAPKPSVRLSRTLNAPDGRALVDPPTLELKEFFGNEPIPILLNKPETAVPLPTTGKTTKKAGNPDKKQGTTPEKKTNDLYDSPYQDVESAITIPISTKPHVALPNTALPNSLTLPKVPARPKVPDLPIPSGPLSMVGPSTDWEDVLPKPDPGKLESKKTEIRLNSYSNDKIRTEFEPVRTESDLPKKSSEFSDIHIDLSDIPPLPKWSPLAVKIQELKIESKSDVRSAFSELPSIDKPFEKDDRPTESTKTTTGRSSRMPFRIRPVPIGRKDQRKTTIETQTVSTSVSEADLETDPIQMTLHKPHPPVPPPHFDMSSLDLPPSFGVSTTLPIFSSASNMDPEPKQSKLVQRNIEETPKVVETAVPPTITPPVVVPQVEPNHRLERIIPLPESEEVADSRENETSPMIQTKENTVSESRQSVPEPVSDAPIRHSARLISAKDSLLSTHELTKSYSKGKLKIPVLKGVQFGVLPGEFVSIVGQSGSGKSTLLHILGTLDSPDSGTVNFDGERIDNLPIARRDRLRNRSFGFIFQFYHLLPELTTLENVLAPLMIRESVWGYLIRRRQHIEKAKQLLEQVGLTHRLTHKPNELSGGEMQRAAIARALVSGPKILLADEPTGNLDARSAGEIIELLQFLNKEHQLTIVMVTHDNQIAFAADRIVRMVDGIIST